MDLKMSFPEDMDVQIAMDKEALDELYADSSFCVEGVAIESFNAFCEWVDKHGGLKKRSLWAITGVLMNEVYKLTGSNAYPDDTLLVCIKLKDIKDIKKLALERTEIGGRWFDDIVDNNAWKQRKQYN